MTSLLNQQKLCLYNFEWQAIRTSLYFSDIGVTNLSITRLTMYLDGHSKDITYVYRVLNLLCAVRMGAFGSLKLASTESKKIDVQRRLQRVGTVREIMSNLYQQLKSAGQQCVADSHSKMLHDLRTAYGTAIFERVRRSLQDRWEGSGKNEVNRPELKYYLDLMSEVAAAGKVSPPVGVGSLTVA